MQLLACQELSTIQKNADNSFGDQHFKTAIALIELHKVRFGEYPEQLEDIQFSGNWDVMALQSVSYQKKATGYDLNVETGWVAEPDLKYPEEFWQGLGIQQSNMK